MLAYVDEISGPAWWAQAWPGQKGKVFTLPSQGLLEDLPVD